MNVLTRLFDRRRARPAPRSHEQAAPLRPDALAPGTRLRGIRIERPIARGASAMVYAGVNEGRNTPVAVKVLCPPRSGDGLHARKEAGDRFLRDAERASRLMHAGIVRLFGGGHEQGLTFAIMELLPGSPLTRYAQVPRLLPEPVALGVGARLAEALAYAHRAGVVHRDVKPANVMFDPATDSVKLTDFGLARSADAEATRSGLLLGSPAYMAPELLAGARADARSDIYALGVLLFELLTGQLPFAADSMGALLRAIATQAPRTVRSLRPDLPAATAAALDKLLEPALTRSRLDRLADGDAWAAAMRLACPTPA
jgi:serine/threonine protein kinase